MILENAILKPHFTFYDILNLVKNGVINTNTYTEDVEDFVHLYSVNIKESDTVNIKESNSVNIK